MDPESINIINSHNAEHYTWGDQCDGWHLVKSDSLSIIQERMSPGPAETKHYHQRSRQFFFILSGEATMEIGSKQVILHVGDGIEIPPLVAHQLRNDSTTDLHFMVTSMPKSHGDRVVVESIVNI